jgi:hypothetical protein
MMIAIRDRLCRVARAEGGLTLVEIVVAMFIFTIISVGVLYTMMSLLSVTRDSRSRQVAANLAAQEIDLARDISDIFNVGTYEHDVVLNGDTFSVSRTQEWVYSSGDAAACGTGTGALRYKFVHVSVTWPGMRGGDDGGVTSETFINPNERINDVTKGSLVVGVTTVGGEGVQNATVTAVPSTGSTLTGKTDVDGCVFFLGVVPNSNFTVTVTAPPATTYVDFTGDSSPSRTGVSVVAGSATSLPFTYDPAGTLRVTYAPTAPALLPLNLSTSLLSTRDTVVSTATAATNPRSWLVSPNPNGGYAVVAGNTSACWANDPGLWTADGGLADGQQPEPVNPTAGNTVDATVTMSTVTVTGMSASGSTNRYLVAVGHAAAMLTGEPTCVGDSNLVTLRWAQTSTTTMTVALPYGSWDFYKGSSSSFSPTSGTKITSGMTAGTGGSISSGVVTLDPRGPAS